MSRLSRGLALLLLAASPAAAQQEAEVRRGDLKVIVHVRGSVIATDMIRLKSQIEGRVEELNASTYTWVTNGRPLGFLASKEMAAILDSNTTTIKGVVQDRWKKVYKPTPINCPDDCFLMRVFTRNKEWLKPRALLFEAAQKLQMVGRVRPEDAQYIRDGQTLDFWPVEDPSKKMKARITNYVLDIQGEKVEPGGTFTMDLSPDRYLDPGTAWEGVIIPKAKRNVLMVPTEAVTMWKGQAYVTVRVSTGITTSDFTEITAGLQEKRPVLILDDSKLGEMDRHKQDIDMPALHQRQAEQLREKAKEREKEAEKQRKLAEKLQRDAERTRESAPVAADNQAPPLNSVPQTIEPIKRPRKEKMGNLPDPDATYSETPQGD